MRNRAAWLREYPGLQRAADGYPCLGLLLKNHRRGCRRDYARTHSNGTPCFLEGADHVSLWRAGGRVACYVFQPYHVGAEMEKRLASLADEHGFHIVIRGTEESFWFAGSTSIIEVWHNRETCEAARSAIMTV